MCLSFDIFKKIAKLKCRHILSSKKSGNLSAAKINWNKVAKGRIRWQRGRKLKIMYYDFNCLNFDLRISLHTAI